MAAHLTVALIGAGYFSQFHADAWRRIEGARLAAVVDPNAEAARSRAGSDANVYPDVAAMLRDLTPDIVDIAAPPAAHLALIRELIPTGATIVCQKPFCTSTAEARDVTTLAEAAGVTLVVHENFRFEPWHRKARALLDDGALGTIYQITFRLRPGDGQGPGAYLARQPYFQKMPRFLIRETGIHFVDTFRFLMGEITAVTARLARLNPAISGEDAGVVLFDFASGARGVFDANRLVDHIAADRRMTMGEMCLEGSAATLRLDGDGRLFLRKMGENAETQVPLTFENRGYGGDCVHACLAHVVAHLNNGAVLENTARDYLRNLEIQDAIYDSHETGCRRELPSR
jgi:predicted dehydrogenase